MRCESCHNGDRRPARRPQVAQRYDRVAVVTDVPVQECPSCGEIWLGEQVALTLDALLTQMLTDEVVAIRPYPELAPTTASPGSARALTLTVGRAGTAGPCGGGWTPW